MHLVAIAELHGPIETALGPLAAELGTTAYELRLLLNAGLPAVVRVTAEEALAHAAVAAIKRLGHAPVACDRREVVASTRMTALRDFQFEPDGLAARAGSSDRLPYADIAVLLRATQRTTSETVETVKERKLRPVMALATGGLVRSKTITREVVTKNDQREQVLYLFRRSGAAPWILRERAAHYGGLGDALRPTSLENFSTAIALLRQRAPAASYDERLLGSRPIRGLASGSEASDILAHLLARHLTRTG